MLMLLLGFLLGLLLRDVTNVLLSHAMDLLAHLKADLLAVKDKLLVLLHIKAASAPVVPPAPPAPPAA